MMATARLKQIGMGTTKHWGRCGILTSVEVTVQCLNKQWWNSVRWPLTCASNHSVVWTDLDSDDLTLVQAVLRHTCLMI